MVSERVKKFKLRREIAHGVAGVVSRCAHGGGVFFVLFSYAGAAAPCNPAL